MKSVLVQAGSPPDPGVVGVVVVVVVGGLGVVVMGPVGGGSVGFSVVIDPPDGVVLGGRSQSGCKQNVCQLSQRADLHLYRVRVANVHGRFCVYESKFYGDIFKDVVFASRTVL